MKQDDLHIIMSSTVYNVYLQNVDGEYDIRVKNDYKSQSTMIK